MKSDFYSRMLGLFALLGAMLIVSVPSALAVEEDGGYCDIPYGFMCADLGYEFPDMTVQEFCTWLDETDPFEELETISEYICDNADMGENLFDACFDLAFTNDCVSSFDQDQCENMLGGEWYEDQGECLSQTDPICDEIAGCEDDVVMYCVDVACGYDEECLANCVNNFLGLCDIDCHDFCGAACELLGGEGGENCYNDCVGILCNEVPPAPEFPSLFFAVSGVFVSIGVALILVRKK